MQRIALPVLLATLLSATARAEITFTPGHYYATSGTSNVIRQYAPDGTVLGTLGLPSAQVRQIRGLTFGPDGLLYAAVVRENGSAVLALDAAGAVRQTYVLHPVTIAGNGALGQIMFASGYGYVTGYEAARFRLGDPASAAPVLPGRIVYGLAPLPGGNLLMALANDAYEVTPGGTVVREVEPPFPQNYTDVRGVDYDPRTNDLFVAHATNTGFPFSLLRVDAATGALEKMAQGRQAIDVFVTDAGNLLVGDRVGPPRLYTRDLVLMDTFDGPEQMFVTQYVVPEPSASGALALAALALAGRRRR